MGSDSAERRNTYGTVRSLAQTSPRVDVGRDRPRKLSCVSDVHIIVKSEVMDGLRLESGQMHSRWMSGSEQEHVQR